MYTVMEASLNAIGLNGSEVHGFMYESFTSSEHISERWSFIKRLQGKITLLIHKCKFCLN